MCVERAQVGTHVVSIGYRLRGAKCGLRREDDEPAECPSVLDMVGGCDGAPGIEWTDGTRLRSCRTGEASWER